jgi:hypothetical protein
MYTFSSTDAEHVPAVTGWPAPKFEPTLVSWPVTGSSTCAVQP